MKGDIINKKITIPGGDDERRIDYEWPNHLLKEIVLQSDSAVNMWWNL